MNLKTFLTVLIFLISVAGIFGIGYLIARIIERRLHINLK